MGRGIAFPHARLPGLARPLVAVGRSARGLDWDAPDGEPVRLLFLILTPLEEPSVQLRILARLAALASDEEFVRRLLAARDIAAARSVMRDCDRSRK